MLECHSLTVVQMQFSYSGDRLLSISRDRTWAIHHFDYDTGVLSLAVCSVMVSAGLIEESGGVVDETIFGV